MANEIVKFEQDRCSREKEILAFLDGELESSAGKEFEQHLANCLACSQQLNEQKRFLSTLDLAFGDEKSFELPTDFAKRIVIHAESNVSGLRERAEQQRALLIAIALLFGASVGFIGGQNSILSELASNFVAQIAVVAGLVSNLFYDLSIGVIITLRVTGRHLGFASPLLTIAFAVLFIASLIALSRLLINYHRISESQ